jgi:hypothetical protein
MVAGTTLPVTDTTAMVDMTANTNGLVKKAPWKGRFFGILFGTLFYDVSFCISTFRNNIGILEVNLNARR